VIPGRTPGRPLRVGLMSFAHLHAAGFASELHARPDVQLCCADPDASTAPPQELRGAELTEQLGLPYVADYQQLFAWGPDAVVVCSETSKHRDLVELAAAAGVPVLCEKPMATTRQDAEAMINACAAAGVFLMVALPVRYSPTYIALREAVRAGHVGQILGASGTNNGWLPSGRAWFTDLALSGGGALVDHTVHVADLLDDLLDSPAVRVHALTNQILHADRPEVATETAGLVSITYADGTIATIDCSWSQPAHTPTWGGVTLEVVGTEGTVRIDPYATRIGGFDELARREMWLPYGATPKARLIDGFLSALRTGTVPQPDGWAGLRLVQIVTAAQESARTGRPVDLPIGPIPAECPSRSKEITDENR